MKKFFVILLCAVFCLSLAACAQNTEETVRQPERKEAAKNTKPSQDAAAPTPAPTPTPTPVLKSGMQNEAVRQLQQRLGGKRPVHGIDPFQNLHRPRHCKRSIRSPETESFSKNGKSNEQQQHIDSRHKGGRRYGAGVVPQNNRQAGHASRGKMVGELEEINSHNIQQYAQIQKQKILCPALFPSHKNPPLLSNLRRPLSRLT